MAIDRLKLVTLLSLAACLNVVPEVGPDAGGTGGGAAVEDAGAGGGSGGSSGGAGGGVSGTGGGMGTLADGGTCFCTQNGACRPGDSPLACGNTGGVCNRCANGEQCVGGQCVVAMCGPGTCTGCCGMGFCVTPSMQNNFACGSNGAMCTRCMNGQVCRNGACVTPVCDATSCPMGCCRNGQCENGDSRFACGTGGAACANCGANGMCQGGTCAMTPPRDAGAPAAVGSPCTAGGASSCGQGQFCLPDMAGFPGGYCSAQCAADGGCPGGATCVTTTVFGFTQSGCFATCGTCRAGYACQPRDGGSAYCRPDCNGGGVGQCPMGTTCSADSGVCM